MHRKGTPEKMGSPIARLNVNAPRLQQSLAFTSIPNSTMKRTSLQPSSPVRESSHPVAPSQASNGSRRVQKAVIIEVVPDRHQIKGGDWDDKTRKSRFG